MFLKIKWFVEGHIKLLYR